MIKKIIFIIVLFPAFVYALQWPVEKPALKATFGESRGNYYHSGIDIGGGEQEVSAVADGEIIYYQEENRRLSSLPSGLGNFMIIEHDRQLRTMYAHLKKGSIKKDGNTVSAGDPIGISSDTGASNGIHLHFEVIDRELNEFVNPLMLLPSIGDRTRPRISELLLKKTTDTGYTSVSGRTTVAAGKYDIGAVVYDVSEHVNYFCQVAPYKIDLFINGEMISTLTYNSIRKNGNSLTLTGNPVPARDYYIDPANWSVHLGQIDLKPGTARIEISAGDYSGNESSREFVVYTENR